MEFGWGLMIGILSGANIGAIIAGLLAGAKRSEQITECGWDPLQVDQAVYDDAPLKTSRVSWPFAAGSPDSAADF
jgi:hypothetical protein